MAGISVAREQQEQEQKRVEAELRNPKPEIRGVSPPRRELPFAPQTSLLNRPVYEPWKRQRSPVRDESSRRKSSPTRDDRSSSASRYYYRDYRRDRSRSPEKSWRKSRPLPYDPSARPKSPVNDPSRRTPPKIASLKKPETQVGA